jgi:uncharacterized membrane protein YidH (DUF202 family)
MPDHHDHLRESAEALAHRAVRLNRELLKQMSALATAAFGLVAALAWNNAITALFKRFYPAPDDPGALVPLLGYALVVSAVAVLIMLWIGRASSRLKEREEKANA